ncbi:MAG: hypothetical protein Q8K79_15390 [Solirubrobacteraceae bacterium]|nr:hypothetical protein [Solirubrobacteraceae bacterium]
MAGEPFGITRIEPDGHAPQLRLALRICRFNVPIHEREATATSAARQKQQRFQAGAEARSSRDDAVMAGPQEHARLDPERGRAVAAELRALGAKNILIRAAEQGYITELACKMPECFCPEELGGATYFEPVNTELSDWMPTHEHFPLSKQEGGKEAVDNAILAHRLCNRIDYSIRVGRSHARDLERIRKAREEAIARNKQGRGRDH